MINILRKMVHLKCRGATYPVNNVKRFQLTDEQVPWSVNLDHYTPTEFNSKVLENKPWADPPLDDRSFKPKWNEIDGKINRKSHEGTYTVSAEGPLNPRGRTGLKGRGILGKWGPNHAADPIVTRWKMEAGKPIKNETTNLPILQFCAIERKDCGQWAIPGGMVDPGEQINETLLREFMEEALNSLEEKTEKSQKDVEVMKKFFKTGREIYKGYVDDPRNTDNAWMETVAVNFHDDDGGVIGKVQFVAGDDAKSVKWMDIDRNVCLYASHEEFVKSVVELLGAHW